MTKDQFQSLHPSVKLITGIYPVLVDGEPVTHFIAAVQDESGKYVARAIRPTEDEAVEE